MKFLKHKEKHIVFARKVKETCKTGNSKCDIASDFLSLVKEEVLVTMACFLEGFVKKIWNTHFKIMQHHDSIMKKIGCISCHMAVQHYVMNNELIRLEASCQSCEELAPFVNRKNLH